MLITTASIDDLVPIQDMIVGRRVRSLEPVFDEAIYPPIPVVSHNGKFLMGDGHTRSTVLAIKGFDTVRVKVLQTDQDVADCKDGAFFGINSISTFVNFYESVWEGICGETGVTSVRDYPLAQLQ